VPERELDSGFTATLNVTVPLADPLAVPVMVIQLTALVAVQLHPADVATSKEPVPPAAERAKDVEESEYVHPAPLCVTVKVCPAIVIVAERVVAPVFAATLNAMFPLSVPEPPLVIVNHGALLTAVQGQPVPVRTATVPVPPDAVNVCALGVIVVPQPLENEKVFE